MTLKKFHLVFIACASALAFLFALWVLTSPTMAGPARVASAIGALAVGLALIGYEAWFLRYSKGSR